MVNKLKLRMAFVTSAVYEFCYNDAIGTGNQTLPPRNYIVCPC